MVVFGIDSELKIVCVGGGWRCNLKAVEGSKDFVKRLRLIGVKACPELTGLTHQGRLVYILVAVSSYFFGLSAI